MNELIILTAKYLFLTSIIIWAVVWLRRPAGLKLRFLIFTAAAGAVAYGLAKLAGHFISDPRPFVVGHFTPLIAHAVDNGFPSDHTLIAATLAFVVMTKSRLVGGLMLIIPVLVGAARVAAGVHHAVDIAGAIVIAAVGVAIVWQADRMIAQRRQQPAA